MLEQNKDKKISIPSNVSLSFLALPYLTTLIVIKTGIQALQELGDVTQEIFRGDRLPILNIPEEEKEN